MGYVMTELPNISQDTTSILEEVNGAAKQGIEITVFPLVDKDDEIFETLRKIARPAFPKDNAETVNLLFERAANEDAKIWKEAQSRYRIDSLGRSHINEFGVIAFCGPNAKDTAEMIKDRGGHVAVIPHSSKAAEHEDISTEELINADKAQDEIRQQEQKLAEVNQLEAEMRQTHQKDYLQAFASLREELRANDPTITRKQAKQQMPTRRADLLGQQRTERLNFQQENMESRARARSHKKTIKELESTRDEMIEKVDSQTYLSILDRQDIYLMEAPFAQILQAEASMQGKVFSQVRGYTLKKRLFPQTIENRLNDVEEGGYSR
jgi:hypothetical protein